MHRLYGYVVAFLLVVIFTGRAASMPEFKEKTGTDWIISHYKSKVAKGTTTLSYSVVVGPCSIDIIALFPIVFWDFPDGLHHSRVVVGSD